MPLTQVEKNHITETESFRNDVRKTLDPEKSESKWVKFGRDVALLVIGFGLTGVIGAWLTAKWSAHEWENQQRYLARQKMLDKKYALMDETFKDVASTTAAAQDVLNLYYFDQSKKENQERLNNWKTTSRQWRMNANLLEQSLSTIFADPDIAKKFHELVVKRSLLGNDIINLPPPGPSAKPKNAADRKRQQKSDAELQKQVTHANDEVNEILRLLRECGDKMKQETQANLEI